MKQIKLGTWNKKKLKSNKTIRSKTIERKLLKSNN